MNKVLARMPYRHLQKEKEAESVEMVGLELDDDDDRKRRHFENVIGQNRFDLASTRSSPRTPLSSSSSSPSRLFPVTSGSSYKTLVLGSMVAAGVQFGWALQLSLLTPYIQTLGIEHTFSSFIWLCGPITGLVVQPCVGIWSDKCSSKYGRRRPFILIGSLMISLAVFIIGFSADIGYILGDTDENCSTYRGTRWRAAAVFVFGFWMLDLANNTVQGPARALLADLSGPSQCNYANAIFCSWMAFGNILGFSAGASGEWHRWFPFLTSRACCEACGNLKAAFLVSVVFLTLCTFVTLYFAKETPLVERGNDLSDSAPLLNDSQQSHNRRFNTDDWSDNKKASAIELESTKNKVGNSFERDANSHDKVLSNGPSAVIVNLLTSLRHLPAGMHTVLLVMALTWLAWFPFFLFDTDWMGREVYHGNPNGNSMEVEKYHQGVREGAFGLLLNSVILLFSSFLVEPLCKKLGARVVWGISNFVIFACMAATAFISNTGMNSVTRVASLVLFSMLGFPLSITYSVPFSMTAELTAGTGGGQGLATGVLNLSIVVPQMIVSLGAGPWDALFGGGNIPAFALASAFALIGSIVAYKLPMLSYRSSGFHGFG